VLEHRRKTIEQMNGLRPARDGKRRSIHLRRDGSGKVLGVKHRLELRLHCGLAGGACDPMAVTPALDAAEITAAAAFEKSPASRG